MKVELNSDDGNQCHDMRGLAKLNGHLNQLCKEWGILHIDYSFDPPQLPSHFANAYSLLILQTICLSLELDYPLGFFFIDQCIRHKNISDPENSSAHNSISLIRSPPSSSRIQEHSLLTHQDQQKVKMNE